jgi:hypothetical protein
MTTASYLLSFGKAGEFGVFHAEGPARYRRGDRVVTKSHRGIELGSIMREAGAGHSRLLGGNHLGQILRPAVADDLWAADHLQSSAELLFEQCRRVAASLRALLEVFDCEILLDGQNAIVYVIRYSGCDPQAFMDAIAGSSGLAIRVHDLGPAPETDRKADSEFISCNGGDCGAGGCGSCQTGGCSSCMSRRSAGSAKLLSEFHEASTAIRLPQLQ